MTIIPHSSQPAVSPANPVRIHSLGPDAGAGPSNPGRTPSAGSYSASHPMSDMSVKIAVQHMNFYYGPVPALKQVNMTVPANKVTAFIGPSGCGKSTLLRCLNRLNDLVDGT